MLKKVLNLRSNRVLDGKATTPRNESILNGEIAINYSNIDPSLFIKDDEEHVIKFSSDAKLNEMFDEKISGQQFKTVNGQSITGVGNINFPVSITTSNGIVGGTIVSEGNLSLDTRVIGSTEVNTLQNIPTNYREIHAIITQSENLTLESQPQQGFPIEIYVDHQIVSQEEFNELDNIIVTLPNNGNYQCVCQNTVTILEGEFAKITLRTFNGITYIDAQTFYYIETPSLLLTVGDVAENVIMRYNGYILGMSKTTHSTISTSEIGEAILNDEYKFQISNTENGRITIRSMANLNYGLNQNAQWSTSPSSLYWDGSHIGTSNKTDGSNRLYMDGPTRLVVGKNNNAVWILSTPKKTPK